MIERLSGAAMRHPRAVLGIAAISAVGLAGVGSQLELDALPDVTGNLVVALTSAPGFDPQEVEMLVTRPVERALGGIPGVEDQRSLSRYGISAVTVIFDDGVDPYLARQMVTERLSGMADELPDGVGAPELGPMSGGLGEVFQMTVGSPMRTPAELLELVELQLAPELQRVAGVVEVNTWGGEVRTLDIVLDPVRMAHRGVRIEDVRAALEGTLVTQPGANLDRGEARTLLRARTYPRSAAELGDRVVPSEHGPVRLAEIARIEQGALPRLGSATQNGRGETVYVMAQMLRGANALEVSDALRARLPILRALLPEDVRLDVVYDRAKLVDATLHTVSKSLVEGGVLVAVVLLAMLGSVRAGLIVASAIPLSMLGAVGGMIALGIPGNLMSLGAIDFGLLVDGAVVMVEGFFHAAPRGGGPQALGDAMRRTARELSRPVFFSVLVILVVYVPVLSLTGVDGKMFRPMAGTVILALAASLLLCLTVVPAASVLLLRPDDIPHAEPPLVRGMRKLYAPLLERALRHPGIVATAALVALLGGGAILTQTGSDFVPQLDEGDLIVQTTRASDISIEGAVAGAQRLERALIEHVPEVSRVASRIGSPAVATDLMGLEQADVFVGLKPEDSWRPGFDKPALVEEMAKVLAEHDPDAELGFTQPIQMRFNELVGGETSDVSLSIRGPDLGTLRDLAERAEGILDTLEGAADVRITAPPAQPLLDVIPDALAASQAGLTVREILTAVSALRAGVTIADTYWERLRIPVRFRIEGSGAAEALARLSLPNARGELIPLGRVAEIRSEEVPSLVNHDHGRRRIVIGFNVRGGSLGAVAGRAEKEIAAQLKLPAGYVTEWGGQLQNMRSAQARMAIVVPVALAAVLGLLIASFGRVRPALIILAHVPFAGVGGISLLAARGMPLSISAAVGFIALSGIVVLNGSVLMNRILAHEQEGKSPYAAAEEAAEERLRPVLMTALVASLGFVPMMLATGAGAEVQRPLATVVVGGLVSSTAVTLLVLPSLYRFLAKRRLAA